jgi:hypothetical protein
VMGQVSVTVALKVHRPDLPGSPRQSDELQTETRHSPPERSDGLPRPPVWTFRGTATARPWPGSVRRKWTREGFEGPVIAFAPWHCSSSPPSRR